MRRSNLFLPTLKEDPSEAKIVSHQLMLRSGMVRQASAGIYSWLPLGHRVLKRVEQIVREEQDYAGCQEMLMPTIQSAELWRESGRYDGYGEEMLRIKDRHDREFLYGPTNEEQITEIFRDNVKSYRDLPKILYHIQWKFRDEVRPRFGVMRGREFLMKDAYSFDLDYPSARNSYNEMFICYLRTFARLGLRAIPMKADTGPIGGDLSHEFIILADTGESQVYCHRGFLEFGEGELERVEAAQLENQVSKWTSLYAATDEMHDPEKEKELRDDLISARGIEVGHIFYFGTKYSKAMGAEVTGADGSQITLEMGSYGIGVSRLVGAIIEASHDDKGIIWPGSVSPFQIGMINLRTGDPVCDNACEEIYSKCRQNGVEILYDDRSDRAGTKFADMDLIGIPWQLIVGPRGLKNGLIEVKRRNTGIREELPIEAALDRMISE